jgi:hypothetical protein
MDQKVLKSTLSQGFITLGVKPSHKIDSINQNFWEYKSLLNIIEIL